MKRILVNCDKRKEDCTREALKEKEKIKKRGACNVKYTIQTRISTLLLTVHVRQPLNHLASSDLMISLSRRYDLFYL